MDQDNNNEPFELEDIVDRDYEKVEVRIESSKCLLKSLIQHLVDEPGQVDVRALCGRHTVVFEVSVWAEDIKRVIGRKGRTADAIRELLTNFGAKNKLRFILEIMEPGQSLT